MLIFQNKATVLQRGDTLMFDLTGQYLSIIRGSDLLYFDNDSKRMLSNIHLAEVTCTAIATLVASISGLQCGSVKTTKGVITYVLV